MSVHCRRYQTNTKLNVGHHFYGGKFYSRSKSIKLESLVQIILNCCDFVQFSNDFVFTNQSELELAAIVTRNCKWFFGISHYAIWLHRRLT